MEEFNKRGHKQGVILSIMDPYFPLQPLFTWTRVTEEVFKIGSKAFIGFNEKLAPKEKFRAGPAGTVYFVVKQVTMQQKKGYIYRIKRVDGFSLTQLDIDNMPVGNKIRITSRKSPSQLAQEYYAMFGQ